MNGSILREVGLQHIKDALVIYSSCGRIDFFSIHLWYDKTTSPVHRFAAKILA